MSNAILTAANELIDNSGSISAAVDMLQERITRRKSEGKSPELAEQQLACLNQLWETSGGTYQTPKQQELSKNYQASGGYID
jgi:hypothetical protein